MHNTVKVNLKDLLKHNQVLAEVPVLLDQKSRPTKLEPVSFGILLQKNTIRDQQSFRVFLKETSEDGLKTQAEILSTWSDGSVKGLLLDTVLPANFASTSKAIVLIVHQQETDRSNYQTVDTSVKTLNDGILQLEIETNPSIDGTLSPIIYTVPNRFSIIDHRQRSCHLNWHSISVETAGPIRSTWLAKGHLVEHPFIHLNCRIHTYHSTGLCKFEIQIRNSKRAKHPGGIWDLGDSGSFRFHEFSIETSHSQVRPRTIQYRVEAESAKQDTLETAWHLDQVSSGGQNWNSKNHVNEKDVVSLPFSGYQLNSGTTTTKGKRADPSLVIQGDETSIGVAVPEFWQNFPKRIEVNQDQVKNSLFPMDSERLHELQGGEQKTSLFWLNFSNEADLKDLDFVHSSTVVKQDFTESTSWLTEFPLIPQSHSKVFYDYLVECLYSPRGIYSNRELVDEYGWRNFGDIHADHEEQFYEGERPLISHYNNQFDMVLGFFIQFLISGKREYFQLADRLARHVIDIDIYHTQEDRAAYNGGLFWFTDHYLQARTSTHRTYSQFNKKKNVPYGGGPGAEHNFTTGLLLHYYLTGYKPAYHAVLSLANWVIDMDDGTKSIYGKFLKGYTGLASGSGSTAYQGPGRGGGNSINALLDAWTLTKDPKFLEHAELLIRRCIHPTDNIEQLDLLNIEKRWSYTVFLCSLVKYLKVKNEAGQLDRMFAYAHDSLLHYAEWMLAHEMPYFDQRERMEYPTEAWAAQEFRKANVFRLAAAFTEEPLRTKLIDRGNEFSKRAWSDLLQFETRTAARALAVVMVEGTVDNFFADHGYPKFHFDMPSFQHEKKQIFEPLSLRVKTKLKSPRGVLEILLSKFVR